MSTVFDEGEGNKTDSVVDAFLAIGSPAEGPKLALAPVYLGSLYARLKEFIQNFTRLIGSYDVATHEDSSFLSGFLWERPYADSKGSWFFCGGHWGGDTYELLQDKEDNGQS